MSTLLYEKRILVVDDDPVFTEIAGTRLATRGACVTCARDGADALHYFEKNTCDLAVVDLVMPKVDGFRLISILRHMPQGRMLPIVVVTSRRDDKARTDADHLGVDLLIQKPIQWTQFADAICDVLYKRTSQISPVRAA